jgi:hypothetical protein
MSAHGISSMSLCSVSIMARLIYHDGRDWIIEKRGEDHWSFPVDGEEWTPGFPPALSAEDATIMF